MSRVIEREQLKKVVNNHKQNDYSVVLGGGYFDVFHIGILKYLKAASELGDYLVIGVNSDYSVLGNKHTYPIFSEEHRVSILEAIDFIDYIFLFDEEDLKQSILELKPQYFVKGNDYLGKPISELESVRAIGGEMRLLDNYKSKSIDILKELNNRYSSGLKCSKHE